MKILYMVQYHYTLSKPTECAMPRMNLKQWTLGDNDVPVGLWIVTNVPLWYSMWTVVEVGALHHT